MPINFVKNNFHRTKKASNQSIEVDIALFIDKVRNYIWLFGIPFWLFGITDRSLAALADGYLSVAEILQLLTTLFFFVSWLYLKPGETLNKNDVEPSQYEEYLCRTQADKLRLKKRHMISQEYILPFPYLSQIYHLLNLRHLETVHNFSLNNLRILNISHFQPTKIGGIIKFQTLLDSPLNPLKIWRQPIVEVDLILHTPYTIELSIPAYNDKRIVVIFQVFPLNDKEHKFFIDIYSDLEWPKPFLQIILHLAACLTLFEDLPYLRAISERRIERLFNPNLASNHESMLLFKRFVELYGHSTATTRLIEGSHD